MNNDHSFDHLQSASKIISLSEKHSDLEWNAQLTDGKGQND